MSFEKQRNIITRTLGEDNIRLLTTTKAILAGGAITSIFSGKDINDFDIYFRRIEDLITFIRNAYCDEDNLSDEEFVDLAPFSLICTSYTNRSITFNVDELKIQLIHFDYFDSIQKIFDSYDFHHNMGAYDFSTSEFVLDEHFLTDIAERRLTFNAGTKYPIMSTLRVSKYVDRGYKISKKEMFKIALAVAKLNIESWEELEDQLSGFYGIDVRKMFDKTQEFSIDTAIEMLDLVEELPEQSTDIHPTLKDLLFNIEGSPIKDQRIFFKQVQDNGINFVSLHSGTETFGTDQITACDGMAVYCTFEEANSTYFFRKNFHIAILQLVEGEVEMKGDSLVLTGAVKLLGTKEPT
ncbi:hypothetical protein FDH34_gp068 [Serratia phage BF]|uniref:Uncharacterized protein n=2 Tax=Eneladusvirus BF TaxID=2560751 RepID=A0A7L8ZNN8_9CAUD|nr:hypothetical protein FDH34_gp068 [Serratia phage BF]QOI71551.1 hypothetical protein pEaSNUABM47_00067 [Erwinia phage pEa_SNUABM_47]QXO11215.1 hypothetical protein pEaSNUABM19_00069 [Erwinia phage pEa_SNUABM_19]QXO11763.1 hypothetical protein pEaSNUABM44_00067 [Erwinia phage pEa_SNUABM_44]QXO12314.1 hypothetical protein pEaSNUABM49_00068 [Erwinia phage pEa_SNUABM_49]AQW88593.1 hypothetical protein BF_0068 [Serratia phage BF]